MRLGLKHHDRPVAGVNGATVELGLAHRAAVWARQFLWHVGNGFPHHALLNPRAQSASNRMSGGLDPAEMNGTASTPFGGLEVGRRLRRLPHQSVQFLLERLNLVVHDSSSQCIIPGTRFPAQPYASYFNRQTAKSPIDVFQSRKTATKADMHPPPPPALCFPFRHSFSPFIMRSTYPAMLI